MKKEICIILIIVILVVVLNNITQNYTQNSVQQLSEQLNLLKKDVAENQVKDKETINKMKEIEENWEESKKKLECYIEHDELEKVNLQINSIKGYVEAEEYSEILSEIESCIFILEHIEQKYKFNFRNIF